MISLKELEQNLTPEEIIEIVTNLGSDEYIEKEDYIIFKTICHHKHAENASMKLYYYKKNKRFHCFTDCGCNFNIYELFKRRYKTLGIDYNFYEDIVKVITKGNYILDDKVCSFFTEYKSDFDRYEKPCIQVNLPKINSSILNIFSPCAAPEWTNEGIGLDVMKRYNILYSIDENKIIIPHYNENGVLVGIRGRALNEEDIALGKYRPVVVEGKVLSHPLGYNLYGLNFVKDNIKRMKIAIAAEAEKSVLLYETMFGKENNICVAVCGSNFTNYQFNLLYDLGIEKLIIAFDKEGENWEEKQKYYNKLNHICSRFKNKVDVGFMWDTKNLLELKDSPFDKGKETFLELYKGVNWL